MASPSFRLLLTTGAFLLPLAAQIPSAIAQEPQMDQAGTNPSVAGNDPLPPGAVRRFVPRAGRSVNAILCVACSPDGKIAATGGDDQQLHLFDLATGEEMRILRGHRDIILTVAFSPDGKLLASGS